MNLNALIKIWAKESKKSPIYIELLCNEFKKDLIKQGMNEDNPKIYQYIIIKVKKKLGLETNSVVLKNFKNFLEKE